MLASILFKRGEREREREREIEIEREREGFPIYRNMRMCRGL